MKVKVIILAAGKGTRMGSDLPKVLHPICGQPMIRILLDSVQKIGADDVVAVIGPDMENVRQTLAPVKTAIQTERLGTAHAVLAAKEDLAPFDGCALILFGDSPLVQPKTLMQMVQKYQDGANVVVLGFIPPDARRYGRLVMSGDGLEKIVEYKDATDEQRAIRLCNSGVMCIDGRVILDLLNQVTNDNVTREYYLTDIVEIAHRKGLKCDVVIGDEDELHGINTPDELETAQEIYMHLLEQNQG